MLVNAISSGITGMGLAAASGSVARIFGVSQTEPFVGVGLFLMAFATLVYMVSRQQAVNAYAVRFVIAGDSLWVAASLLVLAFRPFSISLLGYLSIAAVGVWVAVMAYLQFRGLNQLIKSN